MEEKRTAFKLLVATPDGKRSLGRPYIKDGCCRDKMGWCGMD
jgi:hypothetical protein